jgi:hypothetical protein
MLFLEPQLKNVNMNLKNLMLAIPALLITGAAVAQQTYIDPSGGIGYIYNKKGESQPATGTQYYVENFFPARINDAKDIALVRYNAFNGEMELKINDQVNVLQPSDKQAVTLTNGKTSYQYLAYTNKDNTESQGYLIVLNNDPKFKIFKKERIELIPEHQPAGGYDKYKAAFYKKLDPHYFVQTGDGKIIYTDAKKKDFQKMFEGKEKEISAFMKENKIDTSDDADLAKLGAYISSLL